AGAVGAQKAVHFTGPDAQVEPVQGGDLAEPFDQSLGIDCLGHDYSSEGERPSSAVRARSACSRVTSGVEKISSEARSTRAQPSGSPVSTPRTRDSWSREVSMDIFITEITAMKARGSSTLKSVVANQRSPYSIKRSNRAEPA